MPYSNEPLPLIERRIHARKRVLVIEEDALSRIESRLLLELHGYQVEEVSNGAEAMSLLKKASSRLDLVVLGCEPSLLHGLEIIQALRAIQPGLKAILSSANPEESRIIAHLPRGTAFLSKPCTLHEFSGVLDRAYDIPKHNLAHGKAIHTHRASISGYRPHYPPR